jgi:sec-independent protein translocase protein TatC
MPFLDHLEELRWRVLYSLLAIVVATLAGWFIVERVDVMGLLIRPIAPLLPGGKLKFTNPTEPFFITLKVAFAVGVLLASPIVVYQIWAFLAPALYERERRLVIPALSVGVLLFLAGASAAYFWVLPRALQVLFSFQRNVLEPIITADHYFAFAAQIIIAFGLMTELPLVVVILAALGLVTPQFLARNRRYAVVVSAVAAALLSPPDAVSMVLMMIPLWLLYEVSIFCAWIVTKRGTRRDSAATGLGLLLLIGLSTARGLSAQAVPLPRDTVARRPTSPGAPLQGQRIDTATARKLGLPTGPTRSFPAADAVMDSLLRLQGFRVTQYAADTLIVTGDSQTIFLRGQALLDRGGTKLEADSVRFREATCRLDAAGDPKLFEQGTVIVGEGMRYDTCLRRGTVHRALTEFQQGGVTWYLRGDLAVDSGSTRLYGAATDITSDDHPVPDYHFATRQIKWLNKSVMVARPAVLYVHDVPILWLPFIFQDVRPGRRSGMLAPRLGVNDLVRPTRSYHRHFANLGYFLAINDYLDVLASADWYADRNLTVRGQARYRWLDRFVDGSLTYSRVNEINSPVSSSQISWQHVQSFDSRTRFNASVNYATSGTVLQQNSVDPFLATASLASQVNFDKRFGWGALNIGGSRSQDLSSGQLSQVFPRLSLTPSPVNITPSITWSPGFSYTNQQTFHSAETLLPIVGAAGMLDTLALFAHTRQTSIGFQTPLRFGRWNLDNSLTVNDGTGNQRLALEIPDSTAPGGRRRVVYAATFSTMVDWQTGINLPQVFSGTWKLQPGLQIVNTTSAGPFMLRNQFSGGQWVQQGKRLQFSVGLRPAVFAFFPGLGPVARIRHSVSPIIDYRYAPGGHVPDAFARALDPTGTTLLNARTDPQQTISIGLSQNFEAKLRPARGDTSGAPPRKLRLLSINTSSIAYNFEQAKQPGRVGWQTQTVGNTFASDLLPNFSLSVTHDLWNGPVGLDTSRFSPFLQNVNASFAVTPATLRGLAGLLGLRHHGGPSPPAAGPASLPAVGTPDQPGAIQPPPPVFGGPQSVLGPPGGGQGFSLNLSLTINRTRATTVSLPTVVPVSPVGQQQLNTNLSFRPTEKWQANWTTAYDLVSHQFGQHYVRLERDLHRWRATFSFAKSSNGNFAFSFSVSLLDEPDIKFDYEQQTLQQ